MHDDEEGGGPMTELFQFIAAGVTMGAIYALVALGFSITFSATGVVNFAQGEFVMLGGLLTASLHLLFGWPLALAALGGLAIASAVGLALGLGIRRLEHAGEFRLVLVTLATAITIEAVALMIFGTDPTRFTSPVGNGILRFGGVTITHHSVLVIAVTMIIMVTTVAFFRRTRWGRAMVATSIDRTAAASLGINTRLVIALAFILAAVLGAIAGMIITPISATSYQIGFLMSLKGFAAAVLGGMGNVAGAVAGGFTIGILEALGTGFISSGYKNAIALAVLIIALMVRPQGLFGRRLRGA